MWKRSNLAILLMGAFIAPIGFAAGEWEEIQLYEDVSGSFRPYCLASTDGESIVTASHCINENIYFKKDNNYAKLPAINYVGHYSTDYFTGTDVAVLGDNKLDEAECGKVIKSLSQELSCNIVEAGNIYVSLDCALPRGNSGKGFTNENGQFCAIYNGFYHFSKDDETLKVAIFNRLSFKDNKNND